jgi:hypothetical protein
MQNMHDRLGALDGRLSIVSAAGRGTVVAGFVPCTTLASSNRHVEQGARAPAVARPLDA